MNKLLSFALVMAAAIAFPSVSRAVSVGWNYRNAQNGGSVALGPTEVAGYTGYAQANWNDHLGNGQNVPSNIPLNNLVNDSGVPTTVDVTGFTLATTNSWNMGDTASPNARLITDFADQQPSITFSDLGSEFTTPGYSVVVYYSNNEGPTNSNLSITGSINDSVSRTIQTGNTANVNYTANGWRLETGSGPLVPTNVTIFTGLNDPQFTVAITGAGNNGISAIQIVSAAAVPEPATCMLAMVASLGFISVARRRKK